MKRKLIIFFSVIIIISIAVTTYVLCSKEEVNIVVACNNNELSEDLYTLYFIIEANSLNYSDFGSYDEYLEQVRENTMDRICIDAYYLDKCTEEGITLTEEEERGVDIRLIPMLVELGFDYCNNTEEAYREYFNVSKASFREFYRRKTLYEKHFYFKVTRIESMIDYRQLRYIPLIDRVQATIDYYKYSREQALVYASIEEFFNDNKYEYAQNTVELIFLDFPTDEEGLPIKDDYEKYSQKAEEIIRELSNQGEEKAYYHQMPTKYPDFVTDVALAVVEKAVTFVEKYGENLIRQCLNARKQDGFFKIDCDVGIVIARVIKENGREENQSVMEYEVKSREVANDVRRAILREEYAPKILDQEFYDSFDEPQGSIWKKLLEK